MNLVKCPNGHFYDASTHDECPYCNVASIDMEIDRTVAHTQANDEPEEEKADYNKKASPNQNMDFDTGKTMGAFALDAKKQNEGKSSNVVADRITQSQEWIEPVVGWLVCTQGEYKGRDFRLHSERNFVGRDSSNDVIIDNDSGVSRKNHAIISFNPKKNDFKIFPGEGRGIVYLNDEEVYTVQELNAYDIIELGQTKLMFVPFCGENYKWGN